MLTALLTVLFLTACSNQEVSDYDYSFTGESEHWVAEYFVQGTEKWGKKNNSVTYSNESSYIFTVKYKGTLEELTPVKTLEFAYETIMSSGSKSMEFDEPLTEVVFTTSGSSKGGAKVGEDEVIQVHVKWDDAEESFELHNRGERIFPR
ncbi:hypothetical protein ACFPRA_17880 [Sporosarcina soli]|uniref:Lipoprotein n=1 Tax=Sporosarcina soli TaxID=334736 RepID=A0ABW0TQV3_9BACL